MGFGVSNRRKDVNTASSRAGDLVAGKSMGIWLPTWEKACVTINVKAQSIFDVRHRVLHNILADPESSRVRQLLDTSAVGRNGM